VLVGKYKDIDVFAAIGRYGPYLSYNKQFYSLPKDADVKTLSLDAAVEAIKNTEKKNTIKSFDENPSIKVLKGKYGAYITDGKDSYKIPKGKSPEELTCQECLEIIIDVKMKKTEKKKVIRRKK
jgi:DNA topoisomerase-1